MPPQSKNPRISLLRLPLLTTNHYPLRLERNPGPRQHLQLYEWHHQHQPHHRHLRPHRQPRQIPPELRIGRAWSPFTSGRTALRTSFGIHRALLDNLNYRLDQAAPFYTTLAVKNVPVSSLNFSATSAPPAGALISPSNVQTDIRTPTVLAWTFKLEQQIAPNTSLTLAYVGSHGYHQILSGDQNEPIPVTCPAALAAGTVYFPSTTTKANPAVANTTSWFSQGTSLYNALEVDLKRNFAHGFQLRGNYTCSKNLDNGSAWNTSVSGNTPAFVSNPYNPKADWGLAATDVRHLASLNGAYDLPLLAFASRIKRAVLPTQDSSAAAVGIMRGLQPHKTPSPMQRALAPGPLPDSPPTY